MGAGSTVVVPKVGRRTNQVEAEPGKAAEQPAVDQESEESEQAWIRTGFVSLSFFVLGANDGDSEQDTWQE